MSELVFLTWGEVETLHQLSIERFGGSSGLRDRGGAEAAVEQPKHTYYYGGGDVFDVAAAYAFHIAQAQAFLERNEVTVTFDWQSIYDAMIAIADRRMDKAGLAGLMREQAKRQGWSEA